MGDFGEVFFLSSAIMIKRGEYYILVHPVVSGSGKPLFKNIKDRVNLKLVKSETFPSGVVLLQYQLNKK